MKNILVGGLAVMFALVLATAIAMMMQVGDLPSHKTVSKVIPIPSMSSSSVVIQSSAVPGEPDSVTVDADADTNQPVRLNAND